MKKQESFWNPKPMPKRKMPKNNFNKESKDLVKLGVGVTVAGAALGLGLAAFDSAVGN